MQHQETVISMTEEKENHSSYEVHKKMVTTQSEPQHETTCDEDRPLEENVDACEYQSLSGASSCLESNLDQNSVSSTTTQAGINGKSKQKSHKNMDRKLKQVSSSMSNASDSPTGRQNPITMTISTGADDDTILITELSNSHMDEQVLHSMFGSFGDIVQIRLCPVPHQIIAECDFTTPKITKNHALVVFAEAAAAEAAETKFSGNNLFVHRLINCQGIRLSNDNKDNIFVKGLPPDYTDEELESYFSQFGTVISSRFLRGHKEAVTIGALVRFSTSKEASDAVDKSHNKCVPRGSHLLTVRLADSPSEKQRKQQRRANRKPRQQQQNFNQQQYDPNQTNSPETSPYNAMPSMPHMYPNPALYGSPAMDWGYYTQAAGYYRQQPNTPIIVQRHNQVLTVNTAPMVPIPPQYAGMTTVNGVPQPMTQYMDNPYIGGESEANSGTSVEYIEEQHVAGETASASPPGVTGTIIEISNLSSGKSELYLYQIFAKYGAIINIDVTKPSDETEQLGIAQIEFATKEEAARAIDAAEQGKLLLKHDPLEDALSLTLLQP